MPKAGEHGRRGSNGSARPGVFLRQRGRYWPIGRWQSLPWGLRSGQPPAGRGAMSY
jgi:hypothetical protein